MDSAADREAQPTDPRHRMPTWLADLIVGAFVVLAAFIPFDVPGFRTEGSAALTVALAPALVLPLRRRWPLPVLVACLALYAAATALGTLAPGVLFATAVSMFIVANRSTSRVHTWIVAGVTALAVVLLGRTVRGIGVVDPRIVQSAVIVAFAAAAGDAARSHREYIEAITERAQRAERTRESEARRRVTEERLRIARDLHDAVAHQISVISLQAGVASSALDSQPEKAKEALAAIRGAARTVLGEIGDLLEMLRSAEEDDVSGGPQPGLARLDELVRRFAEAGLMVRTRVEGDLAVVGGATDVVAYRLIQEALTNAHKHGAEHRAHVLLEVGDGALQVVVTNPVSSPVTSHQATVASHPGGRGLLGLRERVASVRGVVETGPTPGGYRVAATLPLARQVAQ